MHWLTAVAFALLIVLPARAVAQAPEFGAVNPAHDEEIDHECEPWPACILDDPDVSPPAGIPGIVVGRQAPDFQIDEWRALEVNEGEQGFVLHQNEIERDFLGQPFNPEELAR